MEDQDKRTEETPEDVDAHGRRKHKFQASEEPTTDETEGDDVEAHALRHTPKSQ
ncbi:MAG: hypothetical protein WD689_04830 [Gaiellaceae bacterium]